MPRRLSDGEMDIRREQERDARPSGPVCPVCGDDTAPGDPWGDGTCSPECSIEVTDAAEYDVWESIPPDPPAPAPPETCDDDGIPF